MSKIFKDDNASVLRAKLYEPDFGKAAAVAKVGFNVTFLQRFKN